MEFLKKLNLGTQPVLRTIGIVILFIVGAAVVMTLLTSFNNAINPSSYNQSAPGAPMGRNIVSDGDFATEEMARVGVSSPQTIGDYTGNDAEDYEIKQYNVTIESHNLEADCATIISLKDRPEIIFEQSSKSTKRCNYTFKVAHDAAAEVLTILESLKPKELSETAYTIKSQIEDYASQEEILRRKLDTIEATLMSAESAYDELVVLSREVRDVESLSNIIDSKVRMIERLTNERLSTSAQLDNLLRSKSIQLERLAYTYFSVSIFEQKYVDGQALRDSWKLATQRFVSDINRSLQDITLNLVSFTLVLIKFFIYALIILFIVRFGWKIAYKQWLSVTSNK